MIREEDGDVKGGRKSGSWRVVGCITGAQGKRGMGLQFVEFSRLRTISF
jgi:hypothetical protein